MRSRRIISRSMTLAAALAAFGCAGDSTTAPSKQLQLVPGQPSRTVLTSAQAIPPLVRTSPMPTIVVKKDIDGKGGTLSIPTAGFTLVVPAHAVN